MPAESVSGPAGSTGTATVKPLPPKIAGALMRYRISAIIVGWGLILLCIAIILKYAFDVPKAVEIWGPIHGVLYAIYVFLAFDLGYKARWSAKGTIGVLLAGVIPGVSFWCEHIVHRKVLARERI